MKIIVGPFPPKTKHNEKPKSCFSKRGAKAQVRSLSAKLQEQQRDDALKRVLKRAELLDW